MRLHRFDWPGIIFGGIVGGGLAFALTMVVHAPQFGLFLPNDAIEAARVRWQQTYVPLIGVAFGSLLGWWIAPFAERRSDE